MSHELEVIELGDPDGTFIVGITPIHDPSTGGGGEVTKHEHQQLTPQSVWTVEHFLNRYPSAWSLYDDEAVLCEEYQVQHLDMNVLRVSMDVPTAGTFRCI